MTNAASRPQQPAEARHVFRPKSQQLFIVRPHMQAEQMVARLQKHGIPSIACPTLRIEPIEHVLPLQPHQYDCVFLVSRSAAALWLNRLREALPASLLIGTPGKATAEVVFWHPMAQHVRVVYPDGTETGQLDSTAWLMRMQQEGLSSKRVLLVAGEDGQTTLAQALEAQGATVDKCVMYRRVPQALHGAALKVFDDTVLPTLLCPSSQALRALVEFAPPNSTLQNRSCVLATHPNIEKTARALGFMLVEPITPHADEQIPRLRLAIDPDEYV